MSFVKGVDFSTKNLAEPSRRLPSAEEPSDSERIIRRVLGTIVGIADDR